MLIEVTLHLHIISSNDMKTKLHLFNPLIRAEHSLMTIIDDQVNGLIKSLQCTLKI